MSKETKTIKFKKGSLIDITVIVPCRNEEKYIEDCLKSIIRQVESTENIEILIIDGMSEDNTRDIVKNIINEHSFITLMDNPSKIVPAALNLGINNAKGRVLIRMDAHNIYDKEYISKCVKYLDMYQVDNVGGVCYTIPGNKTIVAKSIASVLSHPFGVGNSYFRIGIKEPKLVDTVPFGCFKKEVFKKIGLFDEDLVRNQDDEFNQRIIKNGGKILLVPDIISYYYSRDTIKKLWKMYFQYGYFKPLVIKKVRSIITWRQLAPSGLIISIILTLLLSFFYKKYLLFFSLIIGFYTLLNLLFSFIISFKEKNIKMLLFVYISFVTIHSSYGLGYIKGFWDFFVFKKHLNKKNLNITLSR